MLFHLPTGQKHFIKIFCSINNRHNKFSFKLNTIEGTSSVLDSHAETRGSNPAAGSCQLPLDFLLLGASYNTQSGDGQC